VSETACHVRLTPQVRGLDDQHIGPAHDGLQILEPASVTHVSQARAWSRWTEHIVGANHATVGQLH